MTARRPAAFTPLALLLSLAAGAALAEWLQPDASYRDAQLILRQALRDTVGHGNDPARLDSLGVAQLRLARFDDARAVFTRVLAASPQDPTALAAFGKLALFADRPAEAESLLALAGDAAATDPVVLTDLYAARLRLGRYAAAAEMAPQVNEGGRAPMLQHLAEHPPYRIVSGPETARAPWNKGYPVPLLRVKLNGESVLMALDTGVNDLLVDPTYARMSDARTVPSQSLVFWDGTRISVQHSIVPRLELGGLVVEDLPAGVVSLRKWSQHVNPRAEPIAGVIGLGLLRRFTPTIDYERQALELRRPGVAYTPGPNVRRIPFQIWGENELTVYGSINGGRRMAMILMTGLGGCGVAAPQAVLGEVGVKAGTVSKIMKGAGSVLQGAPWTSVTVPNVTVGTLVRTKVSGWSGALDDAELWRHGVRRDAILSHDFFKDKRLTIDWEKRELLLEGKD